LHRGMATQVDWSLTSYRRAIENVREARKRRAEMARLVKELDMAYHRLARANSSLVEAWQRAATAERQRAEMVTTISHELRTPLNLVLGFAEMIISSPESDGGVPVPPGYRSDLHAIYRSSLHLLELIDDVLDLAKADVGMLTLVHESTSIDGVLLDAGAMVKEYLNAKGLDLHFAIEADLPAVPIDRLRIRQVLLNLLTNAARFTETGYVRIGARLQGEAVKVYVEDSGRGIPPGETDKLFEEFATSGKSDLKWHGGTGLGLPISKKLVELHQGHMWVESELGKGTTFCFTLPVYPEKVEQLVFPLPPLLGGLDGKPLLVIVTRDPDLVEAAGRQLPDAEVIGAANLDVADQKAEDYRARLVVIDIQDDAHRLATKVPVLQVPLPDRYRLAEDLAAQLILAKPLMREQLTRALAKHAPGAQRILVVDDDPRFSQLVQRMLEAEDGRYEVLVAYTAQEALTTVEKERIDAFLLDQSLPDIQGVELCRRIRALPQHRDSPVLFVTAYDAELLADHRSNQLTLTLPEGLTGAHSLALTQALLEGLSFRESTAQNVATLAAE